MKFHLFVLTLFLLILTSGYSQPHRFLAGLDAGVALPVGKYAGKTMSDESAGLAQPGISVNLHVTYRLSKTVGVTLVAGGQENKKSVSALKDAFGQESPQSTVTASTESWRIGKLMGGGTLRIPLADSGRISFTASATAGACKARVPGFSYLLVYGTGANETVFSAKYDGRDLPWAFCYNIRSGLSFRLSKVLYLSGSFSYFDVKPEETLYRFGVPEQNNAYQVKHPLTSLSAEAGIEILL